MDECRQPEKDAGCVSVQSGVCMLTNILVRTHVHVAPLPILFAFHSRIRHRRIRRPITRQELKAMGECLSRMLTLVRITSLHPMHV